MKDATLTALGSLDPAEDQLTAVQQQRAEALLERIVSTPSPDRIPRRPASRTRRSRRLTGLALVAAVVAIAVVVFPGLGRTSNAYASWTATPAPVASGDLSVVTQACRDKVGDHSQSDGARFDSATIPVSLAERRGDLVTVLFHQNNPDVALACVVTNRVGSSDVDDVDVGIGGSSGPAWTPAPNRITQGVIASFGDRFPASVTEGAVGTNVAAMTIHSSGLTFRATVKDGRYAAWWPGRAFVDAPRQPSGQGGPQLDLTYDVTLADGTTLTNVAPATP